MEEYQVSMAGSPGISRDHKNNHIQGVFGRRMNRGQFQIVYLHQEYHVPLETTGPADLCYLSDEFSFFPLYCR
jgi:hypothetical protein